MLTYFFPTRSVCVSQLTNIKKTWQNDKIKWKSQSESIFIAFDMVYYFKLNFCCCPWTYARIGVFILYCRIICHLLKFYFLFMILLLLGCTCAFMVFFSYCIRGTSPSFFRTVDEIENCFFFFALSLSDRRKMKISSMSAHTSVSRPHQWCTDLTVKTVLVWNVSTNWPRMIDSSFFSLSFTYHRRRQLPI